MSEFKPGDMVECVNDGNWRNGKYLIPLGTKYPVAGGIYTVRAIIIPVRSVGLYLQEIQNAKQPFRNGMFEPTFGAYRFRLIKPPATDIQIFRDIVREVFEGANA